MRKLEGNPVAQQSDNTAKEVLQIAENLYDEFKAATWLNEENYFQFAAIIHFLRDIARLEARTTDKVQPTMVDDTV